MNQLTLVKVLKLSNCRLHTSLLGFGAPGFTINTFYFVMCMSRSVLLVINISVCLGLAIYDLKAFAVNARH